MTDEAAALEVFLRQEGAIRELRALLWQVVDAPRAATERGDVGVILPPGTWEEIAEAVGYDEMGG